MPEFTPPLVMSIHGIRTHAEWQNTLSETLSAAGIQFRNRRFGYYPVASFVRDAKNQKHVDDFVTWYQQAVAAARKVNLDDPSARPSIIGHSFGSFVVGYAMLKYPEIKFDKIIFCGCILPPDFDWHTLFVRDQVARVRNECGGKDIWAASAKYFVRGTGAAGRTGFGGLSNRCRDEFYDYQKHSDFFTPNHIEQTWLPFLKLPPPQHRIVHGADIAGTPEMQRLIHRTRAVDRVRYGPVPLHERVAIPYRYSERWRAVNPDIYTFIVDRTTSKACGYINAMPLEDWAYQAVTTGKLLDPQIPGEAVVPYLTDQRLKVYVMSIAVAKGKKRESAGLLNEPVETLFDAFFWKLRNYARRNIRVTEVAAVGWTPEGSRMCESLFGMQRDGEITVKSADGSMVVEHPVYKLKLDPSAVGKPALRYRGLRKLLDTYATMT